MISVNDFRTGLTISVDNALWQVLDFQHVKPGKGVVHSFVLNYVIFAQVLFKRKHSVQVRK